MTPHLFTLRRLLRGHRFRWHWFITPTIWEFAERARTEMLRHLGMDQGKLRAETGLFFVVRRIMAEFLRPARLDDELTVETRVRRIGGASLDLDQEVRLQDRPLVRLALAIACLGRDDRPARLPITLKSAFASLGEGTERKKNHGRY